MTTIAGPRPTWLTFDCYGTLIQWDEGLLAAFTEIVGESDVDPEHLISTYDRYEHELEQTEPATPFRDIAARALGAAMTELELVPRPGDAEILTSRISAMPPFPEVVPALAALKERGYRLCIVSNTDDEVIAGNVAQLGGHIDEVVTAQQAHAYKPSAGIFQLAWDRLGVERADVLHVCASPHLDLQAARDLGFRAVWVDRGTGRMPLADYRSDAVIADLSALPALLDASWR